MHRSDYEFEDIDMNRGLTLFLRLFLTGIVLFISITAFSHPHLFIKPSLELFVEDGSVSGIRIVWEWDKWWSAEVVAECDSDKNGVFDAKETKIVFEDFFSAVKSFGYFTAIYVDGKSVKIDEVLQFAAFIDKDKIVTYSFVVPFAKPVKGTGASLKIDFNDETVYTAFDRGIKIMPNDAFKVTDFKSSEHGFYGASVSFKVKGK